MTFVAAGRSGRFLPAAPLGFFRQTCGLPQRETAFLHRAGGPSNGIPESEPVDENEARSENLLSQKVGRRFL
jgi:hypothetical protein